MLTHLEDYFFKVKSNKLSNDDGGRVFDAANQH